MKPEDLVSGEFYCYDEDTQFFETGLVIKAYEPMMFLGELRKLRYDQWQMKCISKTNIFWVCVYPYLKKLEDCIHPEH